MFVVFFKVVLKVSGLVWFGYDNVLVRCSWDYKVEKILVELRVFVGKKYMVKVIIKMVEEVIDFVYRLCDELEDYFGFVEMFGVYLCLGVVFVCVLFVVV